MGEVSNPIHIQEIKIHTQSIAIRNRAIAADIRAIGIYIRATATDSSTFANAPDTALAATGVKANLENASGFRKRRPLFSAKAARASRLPRLVTPQALGFGLNF